MRRLPMILLSGIFGATLAGAGEPARYYFDLVPVPGTECRVSKDEVTQAQYLEIMGENPSSFRDPKRPVESVSWDDAVAFCEALTKREHAAGRLPADEAYDLPTDAQWDAFAAGSELKDGVTSLSAPHAGTEPAGTHAANPLGLHDVVGNVWEWCKDWYDNAIRRKDSNKDMPYIPTDAEAAADGLDGIYKVLRGGAWDTTAADGFTLASRLRYAPGMSNYRTGFRCVVVKAASAQLPDQGGKARGR